MGLSQLLVWLLGVLGTLVMFAAGVPPQDAASNLSAWANWAGIENIPPWLATNTADNFGLITGASLIAIATAIFGVSMFRRRSKNHESVLKIDFVERPPCIEQFKEADEEFEIGRRYSVVVRNTSPVVTIEKVRCVIKRIKDWDHAYPNAKLQPIQGPAAFQLAPLGEQVVRVFEYLLDEDVIRLCYRSSENINTTLPRQNFSLYIEAQGVNATTGRWFDITTIDNNKIVFSPSE